MSETSKNIILYGPPGTGKTYNTVLRALKIIEGEEYEKQNYEENYPKALKKFNTYINNGNINNWKIAFTTFHQSYTYEDFLGGIAPVLDDTDDGAVKYKLQEGSFFRFCNKAKEDLDKSAKLHPEDQTAEDINKMQEAWSKYINELPEGKVPNVWLMTFGGKKDYSTQSYCFENGQARLGYPKCNIEILKNIEKADFGIPGVSFNEKRNRFEAEDNHYFQDEFGGGIYKYPQVVSFAGYGIVLKGKPADPETDKATEPDCFIPGMKKDDVVLAFKRDNGFKIHGIGIVDDDETKNVIAYEDKNESDGLLAGLGRYRKVNWIISKYLDGELIDKKRAVARNQSGTLFLFSSPENEARSRMLKFEEDTSWDDVKKSIDKILDPNCSKNDSVFEDKDFSYDEFRNRIDSTIRKEEEDLAVPRVFIIDEINRGNVSKIFGETISLIEESKRYRGKYKTGNQENEIYINPETLEIRLPFQGEKDTFTIPDDVYIIGTMNTADRSLTQLDTALRRRFSFEEMMPNPDLLKSGNERKTDWKIEGEISLSELLKTINERIEVLYDREHQIGHAHFMRLGKKPNVAAVSEVFKYKVMPLLQEYFNDDYEKIKFVLADWDDRIIKRQTNPAFEEKKKSDMEDVGIYIGEDPYEIDLTQFDKKETYERILTGIGATNV